jgi:CdiI immunity protein
MSLENFFLSYLNTDFDLIDGTPEAGVEAFVRYQPADEVRQARAELVDLLERTRTDDDALLAAVYDLGCGVVMDARAMRHLLDGAVERWSTEHRTTAV